MLKKTYRLSSVRLRDSRTTKGKYLVVRYSKNDLDYPRFGFVISKKIDKRAVVRNSLKRKLSVSIEEIFDRIKDGTDFVFIPNSGATALAQEDLAKEVVEIFKKEKLIK